MGSRRIWPVLALLSAMSCTAAGQDALQDTVTVGEAVANGLRQSSLTLFEAKPFHLKVTISVVGRQDPQFSGTLEEYWISAEKWSREIKTPGFSQKLVVKDGGISEENSGDYYPHWLSGVVKAVFDPYPQVNDLLRTTARMPAASGGASATACGNFQSDVDRWEICFEGNRGLLISVLTKGYAAEFSDFQKFGKKRVARMIRQQLEPGTILELKVVELTEVNHSIAEWFTAGSASRPPERIRTVRVDEKQFRDMVLSDTAMPWLTMQGGEELTSCAVFATTDRTGRVREVWPTGCANAEIENRLREAVKTWRLRPGLSGDTPVQVESLLRFKAYTNAPKPQ